MLGAAVLRLHALHAGCAGGRTVKQVLSQPMVVLLVFQGSTTDSCINQLLDVTQNIARLGSQQKARWAKQSIRLICERCVCTCLVMKVSLVETTDRDCSSRCFINQSGWPLKAS